MLAPCIAWIIVLCVIMYYIEHKNMLLCVQNMCKYVPSSKRLVSMLQPLSTKQYFI